jgi:leader peptidase (prepilin peptidase)/N-methyltransferase
VLFVISSITYLLLTAIVGLIVGSFLSVVIYRLPIMLHEQFSNECNNFINATFTYPTKKINLFFPRSHCSQCQTKIPFYYNIPLFSFFWLQKKCHQCKKPIAWIYPLIEMSSAVIAIITLERFGFNLTGLFALVFAWGLLALAIIELQQKILPDVITLPLLWLGLLVNCFNIFTSTTTAIFGAIIGYLSLWLIYWTHYFITKKHGLGYGDFKLFALIGAWLGITALPHVIFGAAISGLLIGIMLILLKKQRYDTPIPFGPFLALAGWIGILF